MVNAKLHSDLPAKLRQKAIFVAHKHLSGFSKVPAPPSCHSAAPKQRVWVKDRSQDRFEDAPVEKPTLVISSSALPNLTLVNLLPRPELKRTMLE